MRDVSKVILCGVVSDAPQTKMFSDDAKVVNFSVKTLTMEGDEGGALKERPAWHKVAVNGKLIADTGKYPRNIGVAEGLAQDSPVYVEGRLRTRKYQNRDGEDVWFTEVRADIVRAAESGVQHINRSIILGNLGQTPELRQFDWGAVMNLRVATSEGWKRRDSDTEETEWHSIAVFGDAARRLDGRIEKGQRVFATGMVRTRKYTDRNGRDRRSTETQAHTVFTSGNQLPDAGDGYSGGYRSESEGSDPWDANVSSGGGQSEQRQAMAQQGDIGASGVDTDDSGDQVPF